MKLEIEVSELDFIAQRLTHGEMTFAVAMQAKNLLDKLVTQANDKEFQNPTPPAPEIPKGE